MTGLQPFRGQVVRQDSAHDVVSPAYDALSVTQRQQFRADHPLSYLHVTRSAEDEPDAATIDNATLVARGRAALERLLERELFVSHGAPAFYAYRLVDGAHAQCGLVCEVPSDYYRSVAKPHESTRAERADLLATHFLTVKAASSPYCLRGARRRQPGTRTPCCHPHRTGPGHNRRRRIAANGVAH